MDKHEHIGADAGDARLNRIELDEKVVEEIQAGEAPYPDLWCWGTNADGSPKHPMARGKHRIPADQPPILWRAKA
jgi:hypothetical protein